MPDRPSVVIGVFMVKRDVMLKEFRRNVCPPPPPPPPFCVIGPCMAIWHASPNARVA